MDMIDFYLKLKKLIRSKYSKSSEFRRHVAMTADVNGEEMIIDIDKVHEYFNHIKELLEYIKDTYDD